MARSARATTPSPAAVLRRVRQDLAQHEWPAGLTVLTGDDLYHLDAAQRELLTHLVPGDDTLALTVFADGKLPPADVVAAARSVAMFAERRVVFVRDLAVFEGDAAPLEAYAKAPPARSFLVVRAPKLDLRRPLHQLLSTAGRLLEFRAASTQSPGEALAPIEELARDLALDLDGDVAPFLFEACAGDLHRVARELEKLAAWAGVGTGGVRKIRLADAREVAAGGGLMDGWEAADALLARDAGSAVEAVRRLLDAGREPVLLLGGLAWRARTLLQAKAMLEAGESLEAVTAAVRAWMYKDRLQQGLRKYTLAELLAFPARLHEADLALKSRGLDARAVLESLVIDLTAKPAPVDRPEVRVR